MLLCKGEGASGEITTGWVNPSYWLVDMSVESLRLSGSRTFLISLDHMPFVICMVNSQAEVKCT
jgi:hypothetical protein